MTTILSPQHLEASGFEAAGSHTQEFEDEFGRGRRRFPRAGLARPRPPKRRRRRTFVRNLIWGAHACPCVYGGGGPDSADVASDVASYDAATDEPQDEIVARTTDELHELLDEVQRTFHATVTWSNPIALAHAGRLPSKPGVYMALRDGKPLYVGQSADVRRRWLGRVETLRQLAVDTSRYTIRVGLIGKAGTETRTAASDSLRRDVEAAIITTTPGKLTNRSSTIPFKVGAGGASLRQHEPDGRASVRQQPPGRIFREW